MQGLCIGFVDSRLANTCAVPSAVLVLRIGRSWLARCDPGIATAFFRARARFRGRGELTSPLPARRAAGADLPIKGAQALCWAAPKRPRAVSSAPQGIYCVHPSKILKHLENFKIQAYKAYMCCGVGESGACRPAGWPAGQSICLDSMAWTLLLRCRRAVGPPPRARASDRGRPFTEAREPRAVTFREQRTERACQRHKHLDDFRPKARVFVEGVIPGQNVRIS